jgi:hypothetical protein
MLNNAGSADHLLARVDVGDTRRVSHGRKELGGEKHEAVRADENPLAGGRDGICGLGPRRNQGHGEGGDLENAIKLNREDHTAWSDIGVRALNPPGARRTAKIAAGRRDAFAKNQGRDDRKLNVRFSFRETGLP